MKFILLTALLSLSLLSPPIAAHFIFPNISSIPSWLNATKSAWEEFHKLAGCHAGDKVDGLSKLKRYFQRFGYIDQFSNFNFTDDFDDALELAIKTYQKNFNLNVTGELDEQTLNQIERPRCGVADIVNGSTAMNSRSNKTTTSHFHTVSHYSFFPGKPRWPANKRDLTYGFLPENELSDSVKSVFSLAFERWSAVTPLTFTLTDSFSAADLKIGFFVGDHGDGEPFDGVLGTLAHAFSPPSGHFHLDGDENWVVTGDISTSSLQEAVDLESVAVHEIGHLLGLGHSSVVDSIMYPTITSRTKKVELASDDVQGIQELYGINPNGNNSSSSTPSVQEKDTSGGSYSFVSLWSLSVILTVHIVLMAMMML